MSTGRDGIVLAIAALLLLWLGCVACGRAARTLGEEDPSVIVWDETVGMLITLVLVPATPLAWLVGFIAFRVLDINKPWLIGVAERRFRGGVAIMADDALAGIAAAGHHVGDSHSRRSLHHGIKLSFTRCPVASEYPNRSTRVTLGTLPLSSTSR